MGWALLRVATVLVAQPRGHIPAKDREIPKNVLALPETKVRKGAAATFMSKGVGDASFRCRKGQWEDEDVVKLRCFPKPKTLKERWSSDRVWTRDRFYPRSPARRVG